MYREHALHNFYMVKNASRRARERRPNSFLSLVAARRTGQPVKNLPYGRLPTMSKGPALDQYYLIKEGNVFANLGSKAANVVTNTTNKMLQPLKSVQLGGPGSKNIGEFLSKPGMTLGQKAKTLTNQTLHNPQFRKNLLSTTIKQPAYNVAQKVNTATGEGVLNEVFQAAF